MKLDFYTTSPKEIAEAMMRKKLAASPRVPYIPISVLQGHANARLGSFLAEHKIIPEAPIRRFAHARRGFLAGITR